MKRLKVTQALPMRDVSYRGSLRARMRAQLRDAARNQGLKAGPITFDEYFKEVRGETLRIVEARMDVQ